MFKATSVFLFLSLISVDLLADVVDDKVNAIYDRMSAAYLAMDEKLLESVYSTNAAYLPAGEDSALLKGQKNIVADSIGYFKELKQFQATMTIEFRVIDRKKTSDMVTDIGFFKITLSPPKNSKHQTKYDYGKFIITSIPTTNGNWAFYNDLDAASSESSYNNAKAVAGWKFDQ